MGGEVIAACLENMPKDAGGLRAARVTLPDAPAPTSRVLEEAYYPSADLVATRVRELID